MSRFEHLSRLNLSRERTARYVLYQVEGEPVLIVASATEANKPYFNKLLQRSGGTARRMRAAGISAGMVEENRDADRELFAQHVVVGWENVLDKDGAAVAFSRETAGEFLEAMPAWLFDELRTFCGDPNNFLDKGEKTQGDAEKTTGN